MKTQFDGINVIFDSLKNSDLKNQVNGLIYKIKREVNSTKEDIVINSITLGDTNVQEGVFNVNIYVPNISIKNSSLPNTSRLTALAELAKDVLEDVSEDNYNFFLSSQNIIEDTSSQAHYINCRIILRFLG